MFSKTRSLLLAASLIAVPLTATMAQQNNPIGNMGSNNSVTATPTTGGSPPPGVTTTDTGARGTAGNYSGSAMNSTTPGATGHTIVPGSTSSQAGSAAGTTEQRTGATTGGNK
jgi:hypothetical protein